MISFRFHVVSITAVFLAIAIGIVVGSTYVDRAIVENLENRIDTVSGNLDERRQEISALEEDLEHVEAYATASADFAVTNRLTDVPVLLIAPRGLDEDAAQRIALLARRAGAAVPGVVWLEPRWALTSPEDRAALAGVLGADPDEAAAVLRDRGLAALVGDLLAPAPPEDGGEPPAPSSQALTDLQTASFVTVDALDDSSVPLAGLAGRAPRVLALTGAEAVEELDPLVPRVVATTAEAGLPTVVAEVYAEEGDEPPARGAALEAAVPEGLRDSVVSVDHGDRPEGQVAAVIGLDVIADGTTGHFGYGAGADGVLPGWSPP